MTAIPLSGQQLAEIRALVTKAQDVEDVYGKVRSLIRASLGLYGEEALADLVGGVRAGVPALLAEVDRLRTWPGLMSVLDELYPPDAVIGDTDQRIAVLVRVVDRERARVAELEAERHETNEWLEDAAKALRTKQGTALTEAANELERQFIVTGDRLIHRTKLIGLLREWAAARTGSAL